MQTYQMDMASSLVCTRAKSRWLLYFRSLLSPPVSVLHRDVPPLSPGHLEPHLLQTFILQRRQGAHAVLLLLVRHWHFHILIDFHLLALAFVCHGRPCPRSECYTINEEEYHENCEYKSILNFIPIINKRRVMLGWCCRIKSKSIKNSFWRKATLTFGAAVVMTWLISITINISDYKSRAREERKYLMSHFPTLSYIRPLDMRAGATFAPLESI